MSIASEITRLQTAKSDLATSIANKGVTVPANATLDDYAALVDSIQTGGGEVVTYDAEIEYLESTGTQYIDTGLYTSGAMFVEIMLDRPTSPARGATIWVPFGSKTDATNGQYSVFESTNASNQKYLAVLYGKTSSSTLDATGGSTSYTKSVFKLNNGTLTYDNAKTLKAAQAGTIFNSGNKLWLFGRDGTLSSVKIYYAKIWVGGNLLRDMIPVRKNGVGYMYDSITEQLFGNDGTGNFTLGSDI